MESSSRPGVADPEASSHEPHPHNGANPYPFASPAAAFRAAGASLQEAIEYAGQLISLKIERIRLTAMKIVMFAVLGVIALIAGGAIVITSAVLICLGLAGAVSAALGTPWWVGALIVGVVLVGVAVITVVAFVKMQMASASKQLKERLAFRSEQQRETIGHDAHEYAAAPSPKPSTN